MHRERGIYRHGYIHTCRNTHRQVLRNTQRYMQIHTDMYTQVVEIYADYMFAHKDTWNMCRYISTDAYTYRLTETHTHAYKGKHIYIQTYTHKQI